MHHKARESPRGQCNVNACQCTHLDRVSSLVRWCFTCAGSSLTPVANCPVLVLVLLTNDSPDPALFVLSGLDGVTLKKPHENSLVGQHLASRLCLDDACSQSSAPIIVATIPPQVSGAYLAVGPIIEQ